MLIAGLTGGIATGKSLVTRRFTDNGAIIVDADRIAHEVVQSGQPAWQAVIDCFGRQYLLPNGEIDRQSLGDAVFADHDKKQQLNQIVHPHVFKEIGRQIEAAQQQPDAATSVLILDVPLLFESGMQESLSNTIVVFTSADIQIQRLMNRDGISDSAALDRINAQMPIEEKKARADFLIDNNGSIEETHQQTDAIYNTLKEKAATGTQ